MPFSWWCGCPPDSWVLSFGFQWDLLPWSAVCYGLNDLRRDHHSLLDEEHARVVVGNTCVVSRGCDCDQLVCTELIDGVKRVLMATHDHTDLVVLEEFVNNVWSVCHNVILLLLVSNLVCLHTLNLI